MICGSHNINHSENQNMALKEIKKSNTSWSEFLDSKTSITQALENTVDALENG